MCGHSQIPWQSERAEGPMSGCSLSRDDRDATDISSGFFPSVCLVSPPKSGIFWHMGSRCPWWASGFLKSFVAILRHRETAKPWTSPTEHGQKHCFGLNFLCLLCHHHLPWYRRGWCRACPRGLNLRSIMPGKCVLRIWKYHMLI